MTPIVITSRISGDGILHLNLPVGVAEADKEVRVTVEPLPIVAQSPEEWRQWVLSTAGKWQGDFERPDQGTLEEREPLS